MDKKAQIRLTETVAILFIFFVLIVFGIIFYYKFHQISVKEKEGELLEARALDTTLKVLFLPELACSEGGAEPEGHCFDLMKARYANETFQENMAKYYLQVFSFARISIHQTYPERKEYLLYDKPKILAGGQMADQKSTFFVVTLRDNVLGEGTPFYSFGYLNVTVYS